MHHRYFAANSPCLAALLALATAASHATALPDVSPPAVRAEIVRTVPLDRRLAGVTIEYRLETVSPVRLVIYDTGGPLVNIVENVSARPPGLHRVRWNGQDRNGQPVAAGVYLYRLEVASGSVVRQIVLER